jgi:hypothetical protein
MNTISQMSTTAKQRMAGLLLLFGTGVVAMLAYALISGGDKPVTPAAQNPPAGTGTVIGATPSPAPSSPGTPGSTPAPGTTAGPSSEPGTPGGLPGGPDVPVAGVFYIAGRVDGLVPGRAKTMPLTVTNPNPWPIHVLTVNTSVARPSASSCPAGSLEVGDYAFSDGDASITAPANGTARVDVPVEMVDSLTMDQTGCKGTTFALTFAGTAEQVSS